MNLIVYNEDTNIVNYTKIFSGSKYTLSEDEVKKLKIKRGKLVGATLKTTGLGFIGSTAATMPSAKILINESPKGKYHQQLKNHHTKITSQHGHVTSYQHLDNDLSSHTDLGSLAKGKTIIRHNMKSGSDAILAHEQGHVQNRFRKGDKPLFVLDQVGRHATSPIGQYVSNRVGVKSGYQSEINKFTGKKSSKFQKIKPWILPAMAVPMLIEETRASRNAMKSLRDIGASKSELSSAKKQLYAAGSTYLISAIGNFITTLISRNMGKKLAKKDIMAMLQKKYPTVPKEELELAYKQVINKNKLKLK